MTTRTSAGEGNDPIGADPCGQLLARSGPLGEEGAFGEVLRVSPVWEILTNKRQERQEATCSPCLPGYSTDN